MSSITTSTPQTKAIRNIQIVMAVSLVLALLVLGADAGMGTVGSYFSSGAVCGLTFVHHVTLLSLAGKQRKKNRLATETSVLIRLPTVIFNWLFFVAWLGLLGVTSWVVHEAHTYNVFETNGWRGLEPLLIALIGAILEIPVLFTFALLSTLERRKQYSLPSSKA
ncbi:hypothetical protein CVT24_007455 [Panaeolus cyanescens]|uniref:Uncharacterized protein n=1 Tax=Panaeolus cyanescens TaxID=181874 RepID=A0A409W4Z6_9AGAR|nr:hypothetical protein CVT24_007455 [Panaeolus cyanescens]